MEKHPCYLVERVICTKKQELCFEGILTVDQMDSCLHEPLTLYEAEAVQIHSVCVEQSIGEDETIEMVVCCRILDACGRKTQAIGRIKVNVCTVNCKGNVKRGAEIRIRMARYCGHCSFYILAMICVQTVVTRSEVVGNVRSCTPACPQLPLYPPPARHNDGKKRCVYQNE